MRKYPYYVLLITYYVLLFTFHASRFSNYEHVIIYQSISTPIHRNPVADCDGKFCRTTACIHGRYR